MAEPEVGINILCLLLLHPVFGSRGVNRFESHAQTGQQDCKALLRRLIALVSTQLLRTIVEPQQSALVSNEACQGLIERRITIDPDAAMCQFMEEEVAEVTIRPVNERIQQRILEPTQRRIGGHPSNTHHSARLPQLCSHTHRACFAKKASIRHATNNRATPAQWREGECGCRDHIPHHCTSPGDHQTLVATLVRQFKMLLGKAQRGLTGFQTIPECW